MSEITTQPENTEEVRTEPLIGEFKPKRKFLNFVSAVNGMKIRYIRDIAFVKGSKLSGILENVVFKITICDEGTINFEEVDTNVADKAMIQRLITEIDEMDVTGYAQKFVVSGLEFNDKDGRRCYLEVEHKKPIDKFKALFEEEEERKKVSDKGLSVLDQLFGSSDDDSTDEVEETVEETVSEEVEVVKEVVEPKKELSYMEQQFLKMKEDKINELKFRIEDKQKDIQKAKMDIKQAESKLKESTEALGVLETRLESMFPGDEPNGYVFYVSEEQKVETGLDDSTKGVADKIADLMGLKKDVLFNHLTGGFYKIKIAKKDDIANQDFKLDREIYEKIMSIDVNGKIEIVGGEFEYRGELNWHQLVGKMIRNGFEQEPEFDKLCQSNSYESKEEVKEEHVCGDGCSHDTDKYKNKIEEMAKNLGMKGVNFGEDGIQLISDEDDEVANEIEESFEDNNGYPIGEEFYFSIYHEPTASNDLGDAEACIAITPKSFWDKEGYQYDQHIDGLLRKKYPLIKSLGDKFEEAQEGMFTISNFDGTNLMTCSHIGLNDTIETMCKSGIKFNRDFQNFMSQKDSQNVVSIITQLGYQNIIC